ncbi:hypothetical protein QYF36_017636 [Acer negundo]|nr:hypothetical protein QYF36_017636 [Acer negundo]
MLPTGVRCCCHGSGQQGTTSVLVLLHIINHPYPTFPSSAYGCSTSDLLGKHNFPLHILTGYAGSFSLPM